MTSIKLILFIFSLGDRSDKPNVIVYIGDGQQNVDGFSGDLTVLVGDMLLSV